MKLKTILKTKKAKYIAVASAGIALLALAGGGAYLAKNKSKDSTKNTTNEQQSQTVSPATQEKNSSQDRSTSGTQANQNTNSTQTVTVSPTLDDVTLQGDIFDKNTGIISISLYGGPGKYTVDKSVNGSWVNIVTDQNYVGTGGLVIKDTIQLSELSRDYRIYRTVDGVKSAAKEINVDRNLIIDKGGSASFPKVGAL